MATKQALTLKEFNRLYDLKAYLENYSGFSIYDMKNFNTIWDLLYTEYFNVYLDFDPTDDYVETVQNSFVSFYYQWIPKLNYHFLKNADLSKELYGNIDINTIKNNPINNDAKSLKDVKDLPIFNANMNGRVDFENFYQSDFSTKIIIDYLTSARVFFILINDVEDYVENILISPYALKNLENVSQLEDIGETITKALYQDDDGTIKIGTVQGGTGSASFKDLTGIWSDNESLKSKIDDVDMKISINTSNITLLDTNKANNTLDNIQVLPQVSTTSKAMFRDSDGQVKEGPVSGTSTDAKFKNDVLLNTIDFNNDTSSNTNIYSSLKVDSNFVGLSNNQSITGQKTLTDYWTINATKGFKFSGNNNGFEIWNVANTSGYLDFIQNWGGGTTYKNWTGLRMWRVENNVRVTGPSLIMDNNNQLRIGGNGLVKILGSSLSLENNKITNLANGVNNNDGVNFSQLNTRATKSLNNIDTLLNTTIQQTKMVVQEGTSLKLQDIPSGGSASFKTGQAVDTIDFALNNFNPGNILSAEQINTQFANLTNENTFTEKQVFSKDIDVNGNLSLIGNITQTGNYVVNGNAVITGNLDLNTVDSTTGTFTIHTNPSKTNAIVINDNSGKPRIQFTVNNINVANLELNDSNDRLVSTVRMQAPSAIEPNDLVVFSQLPNLTNYGKLDSQNIWTTTNIYGDSNANITIEPAYIKVKNGTNASLSLTAYKESTETFTRLKETTSNKIFAYKSDIQTIKKLKLIKNASTPVPSTGIWDFGTITWIDNASVTTTEFSSITRSDIVKTSLGARNGVGSGGVANVFNEISTQGFTNTSNKITLWINGFWFNGLGSATTNGGYDTADSGCKIEVTWLTNTTVNVKATQNGFASKTMTGGFEVSIIL